MKKNLFLVAMLFGIMPLFAQDENQKPTNDTVIIYNNHEIQIKENEKGLKVKVYDVDENEKTEIEPSYEIRYKGNNNVSINIPFVNEKETNGSRSYKALTPGVYYAYTMFSEKSFGQMSPDISQRGRSFEWGLHPIRCSIYHTKNNVFGVHTGLGISNTYIYFKKFNVLTEIDGKIAMVDLIGDSIISPNQPHKKDGKSFLRYWSLHIPVCVQLQFKTNTLLRIAAGVDFEWKFGMRSFARYDGTKHTISDDLNYNPINCNALFMISIHRIVISSKIALNDMFGHSDIGTYPFTIGIGLCM